MATNGKILGVPIWVWGVGAIVLAAGGGGGVFVVKKRLSDREKAVWPLATKYGKKFNIPPGWIMAIARHESGFDPNARATAPRDLARGGSFGLM